MIDWREDAALIARKVRAYNPFPGAATTLAGDLVKIWRAEVVDRESEPPGTVCTAAPGFLEIACGHGTLRVLELQRAGAKRLAAAPFLAGYPLARGTRFGDGKTS